MKNDYKYKLGEQAPDWKLNPKGWSEWFKGFCEYHNKDKRNSFSIVLPELAKLLENNYLDQTKRVKGLGRRIIINKLKETLPELNTGKISRAIKRCITLQVVSYITQSKSRKLIVKGQYWSSYVSERKH